MTQEAGVPTDFWGRIQRMIEDAVAKLARSGMLRNASITGGGLTIKGGFLRVLFPESLGSALGVFFGDIKDADTREYLGTGLLVQGPAGEDILYAHTDASTGGTRAGMLSQGAGVVSTDPAGGLRRPWVGGGFSAGRYSDFRFSSVSGTFETVARAWVIKQHPRLEVGVLASMDTAGTTGEVRVLAGGVPLGATVSIGFSVAAPYFGPATYAGLDGDVIFVEVQARRTSATGALRLEPLYWGGRSSGT